MHIYFEEFSRVGVGLQPLPSGRSKISPLANVSSLQNNGLSKVATNYSNTRRLDANIITFVLFLRTVLLRGRWISVGGSRASHP